MDMEMILRNVLKANGWLGEGKTVETDLCHLCWDEHAHAAKKGLGTEVYLWKNPARF
jgi:hypothetical protein